MSDKVYDFLKNLVMIILPGFSALYLSLAGIWGLSSPEKVAGTIAALSAFLGLWLRTLRRSYMNDDARFEGRIVKEVNEAGITVYSLEINDDPTVSIDSKDSVTFKVI